MTTQYKSFELVYGTQPIMPLKFVLPTKRICDLPQEDLNKAIWVRVEDLFKLDESRSQANENITHI